MIAVAEQIRHIDELLRLKTAGAIGAGSGDDWSDEESAVIKRAYRNARYRDDKPEFSAYIYSRFPGECDEVEAESAEDRSAMLAHQPAGDRHISRHW